MTREASKPPLLPGFDYVRVLGVGGFADVFLYRQHLPNRLVAVKVLLATGLDDAVRTRFTDEANLMAQLSHHPSIVTVHHASVAADGRPYLVMEHCSQPGLGERYRTERIGVAEVLRIGVRLASAVETAHRAGILHRDIKPANVLTTDFGWPALTDFGIAATGGHRDGGAVGLSVPWAPPEMLAEPAVADERSDVYCLAATLYTLLAGRSPFERPGGANGAADLIARIERDPVPAIGRGDVPQALARVLARAMAKHPDERYPSALAVGRALQQVEAGLSLPVTTLDLPGEAGPMPAAGPHVDAGSTRQRPFAVPADPDATRQRAPLEISPIPPGPISSTVVTPALAVDAADATGAAAGPSPARQSPPRGWSAVRAGVAAAVVVAAGVGLVLVWRGGAGPDAAPPDGFADDRTAPPAAEAVPVPRTLAGEREADGSVRFWWTNPDPRAGDRFQWGLVTATGEEPLAMSEEAAATVPASEAAGEVCVQVYLVRADGRVSSEPVRGCAG